MLSCYDTSRYERKYSDTSSECDLSHTIFFLLPDEVVFYTSKLSAMPIQSMIRKAVLFLARAVAYSLLMSSRHIKKSILSIDREFMAKTKSVREKICKHPKCRERF